MMRRAILSTCSPVHADMGFFLDGGVRLEYDFVYLFELVGRVSEDDGAGHVRVVAVDYRANVNGDRLALLQLTV